MGSPDVLPRLLPARPPTPPRESHNDLQSQAKQLLVGTVLQNRLKLQTPPGLYSPDSAQADSTASRAGKKVGFSAQADYHEAPAYDDRREKIAQQTPVSLPPSTSRPAKSILKVTQSTTPPPSSLGPTVGGDVPVTNIAEMLQSSIQQLAGSDRPSRLDAYMMLVRALKTSNNLPDRVALQEKISLFMQFMQRDMTATTETGALDTSMINHSLTLLITFLHFPAIASTLSNDFAASVLDHCIRSFGDEATPKDVLRHLMQVVARQNFSAKVMTSDRVGKLVTALSRIEIQGKSIVMARILIYGRLIRQARQHMVSHNDWLFDLFTDLLSSLKEIRSAAITLGLEAAFSMGKEKNMLRKVMELFNKTSGEQRYIEYYIEVLDGMTQEKAGSASVPQIWSIVILFLRHPIDKWEFFNPWLLIIQKCFNSGDLQTKLEANRAWARLVYVMQLDERTFAKMLHTLTGPIISQLRRKGCGKPADEFRAAVVGGACNLLYYVFRPNANPTLLDTFWDQSVGPVVSELITRKGEDSAECTAQASAILAGLFDSSTPRRWTEDRVVESATVQPAELPAIDPKWLRRSATRVFKAVAPILEKSVLELADAGSAAHTLWRALVASVASAAAKEVKVSFDTAAFIAESFNLLHTLWTERSQSIIREHPDSFPKFLSAIREYISIMTSSLSLLPFTEKILVMNQKRAFAPYATPSRSSRSEGRPSAPLQHAFMILSCLPVGGSDDDTLAAFIRDTLWPFFAAKSAKARVSLARDLLSTLPMDTLLPYGPWLMASEMVCDMLEVNGNSQSSTASGSETPVGHDYRDAVKILERGLRSTPGLPWQHWEKLFCALCERARGETGDAGLVIGVADPLAKVVLIFLPPALDEAIPPSLLKAATAVLSAVSPPKDQRAVDGARRRLWGTSVAGFTGAVMGHIHDLADKTMVRLYANKSDEAIGEAASSFFTAVDGFLERCRGEQVFKAIAAMQAGLECWIRDQQKRLDLGGEQSIVLSVNSIWDQICQLLAGDALLLQPGVLNALERLLCAGFESTRRTVVNNLCTVWNRTFEDADSVQYPEKLRTVLVSLVPHVDIILPGIERPESDLLDGGPHFAESQGDSNRLELPVPLSSMENKPKAPASSRFLSSPAAAASGTTTPLGANRRRVGGAAASRSSKSRRRSPAIRLRHDDSQIQFAPIPSSPSPAIEADSQLLTDRQKEIRDRQKENAALFSDARSSPTNNPTSHPPTSSHQRPVEAKTSPDAPREATPALESSYEAFATSTPTPRRGQPLPLPDVDNEAADPPSSPPEPRRTPLFAEMQPSRSASQSLLDEWHFSSSPIAGSPNPLRQTASVGAAGADPADVDVEEEDHSAAVSGPAVTRSPEPDGHVALPPSHGSGDQVAQAQPRELSVQASVLALQEAVSTSPWQKSPVQGTPRSDNDVFVDALTSPVPTTLKLAYNQPTASADKPELGRPLSTQHTAPQDTSFEVANMDESSFLRLVVELDGRKVEDDQQFQAVSLSPDHQEKTLDCIVVSSGKRRGRKRSSARQMSTPDAPRDVKTSPREPTSAEKQGGSSVDGSRKRKRRSSVTRALAAQKKPRPSTADGEDEVVPDSQQAVAQRGMRLRSRGSVGRGVGHSLDVGSSQPSPLARHDAKTRPPPLHPVDHVDSTTPMDLGGQEVQEVSDGGAVAVHADMERATEDNGAGSQAVASDAGQLPEGPHHLQEPGVLGTEDEQPTTVEEILGTLATGLDRLRQARLSKLDVYKIEDAMMDMKRELFEAERRGRD